MLPNSTAAAARRPQSGSVRLLLAQVRHRSGAGSAKRPRFRRGSTFVGAARSYRDWHPVLQSDGLMSAPHLSSVVGTAELYRALAAEVERREAVWVRLNGLAVDRVAH